MDRTTLAAVRKTRTAPTLWSLSPHFLIELGRGGGHCRSPDVDVSLRMTVHEDKQLYRGLDPRQSLVENLCKRNRNTAVVKWINTNPEPRPMPLTLKMETQQQTKQIVVK